jgi:hypothetical protein
MQWHGWAFTRQFGWGPESVSGDMHQLNLGQFDKLLLQLFRCFDIISIQRNAFHGTHLLALRCVKVANTLSTSEWIDFVDFDTLIDGIIGTNRLTDVAVDALISDYQCHTNSRLRLCVNGSVRYQPFLQSLVDYRMNKLLNLSTQ